MLSLPEITMVRVSGLSLLMLLVLYDAVGSAVGKTFVTTIGKRISIPMKECNNAKRWYKNGNHISGGDICSEYNGILIYCKRKEQQAESNLSPEGTAKAHPMGSNCFYLCFNP